MMFTTLNSRLAGTKAKVAAGAVIAATAMLLAVPAAQAERVRFGVAIGAPVYAAPAYAAPGAEVVFTGPGYYDGIYFRDYNAWHAHYVWMHRYDRVRFDHRGFDHYGRGFYRR